MTSSLNSISLFIFGNTPLIFNFLCILLQTNMTYKTLKIYKIVSMYQKLKLQQPSTEETDNKSNQIKSQANAPINRRLCRNICEIISIDPDLRIKMLSLRSTNDNTKVRPSILKYRYKPRSWNTKRQRIFEEVESMCKKITTNINNKNATKTNKKKSNQIASKRSS